MIINTATGQNSTTNMKRTTTRVYTDKNPVLRAIVTAFIYLAGGAIIAVLWWVFFVAIFSIQ